MPFGFLFRFEPVPWVGNAKLPLVRDRTKHCFLSLTCVACVLLGYAMKWVESDPTRTRLLLSDTALAHIEAWPAQARVYVFSVVGKSRVGKSTLCNALIAALMGLAGQTFAPTAGFKSTAALQAVTNDLWGWSHLISLGDIPNAYAVVVDAEGTEAGHDSITTCVSALSAATSSVLIVRVADKVVPVSDITTLAGLTQMLVFVDHHRRQRAAAPTAVAPLMPTAPKPHLWLLLKDMTAKSETSYIEDCAKLRSLRLPSSPAPFAAPHLTRSFLFYRSCVA